MGKQKRSLVGHLTLTAWESWAAEPHWRNAIIVALVGSIAFSVASPKPSAPNASYSAPSSSTQNNSAPAAQLPPAMANGNATILTPVSKAPPKLTPKISADEVIIKEAEKEESENTFGRSYGEK